MWGEGIIQNIDCLEHKNLNVFYFTWTTRQVIKKLIILLHKIHSNGMSDKKIWKEMCEVVATNFIFCSFQFFVVHLKSPFVYFSVWNQFLEPFTKVLLHISMLNQIIIKLCKRVWLYFINIVSIQIISFFIMSKQSIFQKGIIMFLISFWVSW